MNQDLPIVLRGNQFRLGLGVVAVLLVILLLGLLRSTRLARHLCDPLPRGVREIAVTSDEMFGFSMNWATIVAFQAPTNDMDQIIRDGSFMTSSVDSAILTWRSRGWPVPASLGSGARAYFRVHKPTNGGGIIQFAGNRRWSEYLVIDSTGTNAFFTMSATD